MLERCIPNPREIQELSQLAPCWHPEGVLLYWELLEGTGAWRMLISGCAVVSQSMSCKHPAQPRSCPGPPSRVTGCISGWCWPLIRRNSSGTGCNEALLWLSQDRDDRGGGNFHAGGRISMQRLDPGLSCYLFVPSFLPMCCQHRF